MLSAGQYLFSWHLCSKETGWKFTNRNTLRSKSTMDANAVPNKQSKKPSTALRRKQRNKLLIKKKIGIATSHQIKHLVDPHHKRREINLKICWQPLLPALRRVSSGTLYFRKLLYTEDSVSIAPSRSRYVSDIIGGCVCVCPSLKFWKEILWVVAFGSFEIRVLWFLPLVQYLFLMNLSFWQPFLSTVDYCSKISSFCGLCGVVD